MTEGALLSRLAEQWKSICHREQTERQSIKVRKKETRGKDGGSKREWERKSWLKAASIFRPTPWLSSPSSLSGREQEEKRKGVRRERQRGSSATLAVLAQDSGIPGPFGVVHTHTQTHTCCFPRGDTNLNRTQRGSIKRKKKTEKIVSSLQPFPVDYLTMMAPAKGKVTRRGWGLRRDTGRNCWWRWGFH